MMQKVVFNELDRLSARYRRLALFRNVAWVWLAGAIAAGALWISNATGVVDGSQSARWLGNTVLLVAGIVAWRTDSIRRTYRWLAQQVESRFPDLQASLRTAVEQHPDMTTGEFGYLQTNVIRQACDHSQSHSWANIVPNRRLIAAASINAFLFLLYLGLIAGASIRSPQAIAKANDAASPEAATVAADGFELTVEPGAVEIERGSSLLVLARVKGRMPAQGTLIYQSPAGTATSVPMPPSLRDPVFGGRIADVQKSFQYYVQLEDKKSPSYAVTVFEYPRLDRVDVKLVFPEYTVLSERTIEDVRTISVVEGTEVTLRCRLNKPVKSARWADSEANVDDVAITLEPGKADPLLYEAKLTAEKTRRLRLILVDEAGRKNQKNESFSIMVSPSRPPTLKPTFPGRDLEVSALQELDVKATVSDDFGVRRLGLTYSLAEKPPVDVVLAENAATKQKMEVAHQVRFEDLQAKPDELLSYFWWVEDVDSKGQIRRTQSDMYFAEVRPFDEIFRRGEPSPGEDPGNAIQAEQIAKLQKDVINATWKLIRRETADKPTSKFSGDVEQVRIGQTTALERATDLVAKLRDEESQAHGAKVIEHMRGAIKELTTAGQTPSRDPLPGALNEEQAAYQSLLKLRAREHNIIRQNQSQSSQSRSQQQREQMQQLDLEGDEDRYESQRKAKEQKEESAEERENRQVLNRLRELARRQHDLNERLKELQAALEAAKTEKEKEELKKQLQRLHEEQRQILQDTDELQARLEEPANQEKMSEQRQQLEQTREQVRQASEALKEERVGQATTAGTRAEQQFDQLREEFRRRASRRFGEEMKEMRDSARKLEEKERQIAEQLRGSAKAERKAPSLRDSDGEKDGDATLGDQIGEQRQRLSELQEKIRDTIDRAEATEPILSERLYDAVREMRDRNLEKSLEATEESIRQGDVEGAKEEEVAASEGLQKLREKIDRAAAGVLGDETEALRRARDELQELTRSLNNDVQQNDPNAPQRNSADAQGKDEDRQLAQNTVGEGEPKEKSDQKGRSSASKKGDETKRGEAADKGSDGKASGASKSQKTGKGEGRAKDAGDEKSPAEELGGETSVADGQTGNSTVGDSKGEGKSAGSKSTKSETADRPSGQLGDEGRSANQRGQRTAQRGRETGGGVSEGAIDEATAPISGGGFREWSDRLRDVEEMVNDPELRAEAARIRERSRAIRAESKRHSAPPNWDLVRDQVSKPLAELKQRVSEEILKRTSKHALTPLDRDPVPPRYSETTRLYYERLGSGK